jgi:hypothetical protein
VEEPPDELSQKIASELGGKEEEPAKEKVPPPPLPSTNSVSSISPPITVQTTASIPIPQNVGNPVFSEEEELRKKRDLLWRFNRLRKEYPVSVLPAFSEMTPLPTLQRMYEDTVRRLYLDSTVEDYRTYLIGGFMVLEFIGVQWLKMDFQGFTTEQLKFKCMNKYERLLIEIGEKSYNPSGPSWPAELRLLGLIVINAVLFVIGKLIVNNSGPAMAAIFGQLFGGKVGEEAEAPQQPDASKPKPRPKMRGPTIRLNDLEPKSKME